MNRIRARLVSRAFWADALERAFATFVQAIAASGLVIGATTGVDGWMAVASVGGAAAIGSVIWSIVSIPGIDSGLPWWRAVLYRAGKTFLVTLAAALSVTGTSLLDFDWRSVLVTATIAALGAAGKNYLAPPVEVEAATVIYDAADGGAIADITTRRLGVAADELHVPLPPLISPE